MLKFKLGRQPRKFSPRVMHLSAIIRALDMPAPPATVDWTKGVQSWGMMLNDRLGDCTCAAVYHARQIWTGDTGVENTQPDSEVEALYEVACGYNPDDSSTDLGGNEQTVLTYLLNNGYPVTSETPADKITAFFEVDIRNANDIKTVINECGLCYIGFNVPDNIDETPGATWTLNKDASVEGGHAVILVGYDADKLTVISWGSIYYMTWEFFQFWADEAYAIIDPNWVKDGKTPLGLTPEQLQTMMAALKVQA